MANNLIPEELKALIQQYLTDGVLTDKERQVILNKAEKMGLDRDEIDLYLDAEVQKIDQQTDAAVRKQKGKTCPFCGGSVPQLTDKCPHCGENITPEASKELQEIFDKLEDALVNFKSGKDIEKSKAEVERYIRKANLYYENNTKIKLLVREVENEIKNATIIASKEKRKKMLISIFTNPWVWVIIEVIVAIALYNYFNSAEQEAYEFYQFAEGRSRSAEWNAVVSARDNKLLVILFGVGAVIATSIYAMKRKR